MAGENNTMIRKFIYSIGTAFMIISPPMIDTDHGKLAAIVGLAILTAQAIDIRAWNLVILNLAGIGGYFYSLMG